MKWYNFKFDNDKYLILCTIERYNSTDSKKSWKRKPYEVEKLVYSPKEYTNYITSIPFWNGFCGGTCRGYENTTVAGYLPTRVVTISPYRDTKIITTFRFIPKWHLLNNAGWRETEIVNKATTFDYDNNKYLNLYTDDIGVTSSGTFDTVCRVWRG